MAMITYGRQINETKKRNDTQLPRVISYGKEEDYCKVVNLWGNGTHFIDLNCFRR